METFVHRIRTDKNSSKQSTDPSLQSPYNHAKIRKHLKTFLKNGYKNTSMQRPKHEDHSVLSIHADMQYQVNEINQSQEDGLKVFSSGLKL